MAKKDLRSLLNTLLDGVSTVSRSETVVGEPVVVGKVHVIPVHRLKVAFGAGTGEGQGKVQGKRGRGKGSYDAQGAGGAVELEPLAAITVADNGEAHLFSVDEDSGKAWQDLMGQLPDVLGKVARAVGAKAVGELKLGADDSSDELPGKS
jgi:uncharacterized spore protein YtfJ